MVLNKVLFGAPGDSNSLTEFEIRMIDAAVSSPDLSSLNWLQLRDSRTIYLNIKGLVDLIKAYKLSMISLNTALGRITREAISSFGIK